MYFIGVFFSQTKDVLRACSTGIFLRHTAARQKQKAILAASNADTITTSALHIEVSIYCITKIVLRDVIQLFFNACKVPA